MFWNQNFNIKYFSIVFFLYAISCNGQTITYEDIVKNAISNSTKLKIGKTNVKIEEANLGILDANFYPQVTAIYSTEYTKNLDEKTQNVSVGEINVNSNTQYENSIALKLNYELYNFGATNERLKVGKQEVTIKEIDICLEESKLKEEILNHYTKALNNSLEMKVFQEIRLIKKQIYDYKTRLQQAGMNSNVVILNEAINLIDLENKIEQLKNEYLNSLLNLSKLSQTNFDLHDLQLIPLTLESNNSLENVQYEDTPFGKQYLVKITQKQNELNALKLSKLPVISFTSNYYYYGSDNNSFATSYKELRKNSWNSGFNLRWNIFEGFKSDSETKRLELEKIKLLYEYELAQKEFEIELSTKIQNINKNKQMLSNELQGSKIADEIANTNILLRGEGTIDIIVQLEAKIETLNHEASFQKTLNNNNYEYLLFKIKSAKETECSTNLFLENI
jgi:outer membrane protein TolC